MSKTASRKNIEIDNDILAWLEEEYSGHSIWKLVNDLLRAFMNLHKTKGRMASLTKKAARNTLEEMNDV